MALCIARFAQTSASPGSLYKYATDSLPAIGGRTAGWALLLAYTATGASVVGGFINYARVLIPAAHAIPTPALALLATAAATFFAYRDVQASARMMLWIEAASVSMIALVVAALLLRDGLHIDTPQLRLASVTPSGVRLGVVLALFSFVGFESATTLGHEAKNPLRTIPRAVIQSALLAGLFFLTCCYTETLGFRQLHADLGASEAPFRALSALARVPILGPFWNRNRHRRLRQHVRLHPRLHHRRRPRPAQDGPRRPRPRAPRPLPTPKTRRPTSPSSPSALVVLLLAAGLAARGASGADIYAWIGSLAVYGFITAYGLVAAALPLYLRRRAQLTPAALTLSIAAALAMLLAMAGTLYPVPPSPYNWLPYIYLAYLAIGLATIYLTPRRQNDPAG